MDQSMDLYKLEIWLTDRTDFDYDYGYTRKKNKNMNFDIAKKALEIFLDKNKNSKTPLQVDFIGNQTMLEFDLMPQFQEFREHYESKSGKKLNYLFITTGYMDPKQTKYFSDKKINIRSSINSMEPTDAWWYKVESGRDLPDIEMEEKISIIRRTFPDFQYRMVLSPERLNINERLENFIRNGYTDIHLVPQLINDFHLHQEKDLKDSLKEFAQWFKKELINRIILPVVNAKRMLYLIHQHNQETPYKLKNRCCNINERIMLDVDGVFRPCRHFDLYPVWELGNTDKGIFDPKRKSIYQYGLIIKNGCKSCAARFYCDGPCPSTANIYAESYIRSMGYHCLFTENLVEVMEYVYNSLAIEHPHILHWALKKIGNPMG